MLKAVDLFCGAGGTTTGAMQSGVAKVVLAVNHWKTAIYTHENNYPDVRHVCARMEDVNPADFRSMKIDLILASPECTGHSNARGGRPTTDQQRASGKEVLEWTLALNPKWLVVENVREWMDWGPLGSNGKPLKRRKGEFFKTWVDRLQASGRRVEWRLLNAADYGEATSRTRLFVLARRGNKAIPWPKPTHSRENWRPASEIIDWSLLFPSIFSRKIDLCDKTINRVDIGLRKFVGPYIVHLRGTSTVQNVADPLSTVTGSGAHHAVALPFTLQYHNGPDGANRSTPVSEPLPTLDTNNRHAIGVPFITPNFGERPGQDPRTHDVQSPVPAVTSHGAGNIVVPYVLPHQGIHCNGTPDKPDPRSPNQPLPTIVASPGSKHHLIGAFMLPRTGFYDRDSAAKRVRGIDQPLPTVTASHAPGHLVAPYLVDANHGEKDRSPGGRVHSIDKPLGSITTHNGKAISLPFLTNYFGTGGADSVLEPLSTLTTKPRHGIAAPMFGDVAQREEILDRYAKKGAVWKRLIGTMRELDVWDIGYRMFVVRELLRAQGFPADYLLHGTIGEMIKQVGNAVCPGVARAICEALAA